jgi:hypothetical protein
MDPQIEKYHEVEDYKTMFNLSNKIYRKERTVFISKFNFNPYKWNELIKLFEPHIIHPEKKQKIRFGYIGELQQRFRLPDMVFWIKDNEGKKYIICNCYEKHEQSIHFDWFSHKIKFRIIYRKTKGENYDKTQYDRLGDYSLHRPVIVLIGPLIQTINNYGVVF